VTIQELRKACGFTSARAFVRATGIGLGRVSQIEREADPPITLTTLTKIAQATGLRRSQVLAVLDGDLTLDAARQDPA
jgi:transcriptional regulator with XRE-family HTH domain